jgi:uncharacterized protein YuzB (UPF0349 family)
MGNTTFVSKSMKPRCFKCKCDLIFYTGTVYATADLVNDKELDIEEEARLLYCKKCNKIRKVWQT